MEKPNYVIKTNEAVLMPVNNGPVYNVLKVGVWCVAVTILVGSLVFRENLFAELSWSTRVLLIVLAIGVGVAGKTEYVPSPMELQFFDEYLVLYLPKRYYSKRVTRMEINQMRYDEITKCVYKAKSKRIHLYGSGCSTWYNYNRRGELPVKPTKVNHYTDGLIYFNVSLAPEVDFKAEIEKHSPLQVIIEND